MKRVLCRYSSAIRLRRHRRGLPRYNSTVCLKQHCGRSGGFIEGLSGRQGLCPGRSINSSEHINGVRARIEWMLVLAVGKDGGGACALCVHETNSLVLLLPCVFWETAYILHHGKKVLLHQQNHLLK